MLFERGMYCHGLYPTPGPPPAATSSHPLFMYIYFIDTTLHSFPLCATTQIHSRSFSDRYSLLHLQYTSKISSCIPSLHATSSSSPHVTSSRNLMLSTSSLTLKRNTPQAPDLRNYLSNSQALAFQDLSTSSSHANQHLKPLSP